MISSLPAFLSLSFGEILVLGLVALLVFGGRLPEVMRNLGRAYARFRQGMSDLSHPIRQEMRRLDVSPGPAPDARPSPPDLPPVASEPPPSLYEADAAPREDAPPGIAPEAPPGPSPNAPPTAPGGAADEPPPV